jgi:hypothetical protein
MDPILGASIKPDICAAPSYPAPCSVSLFALTVAELFLDQ